MNQKTKRILYRIIKIIWITKGVILALIVFFLFIKMKTFSGSGLGGIGGAIGLAVLFAVGIYALFIYIGITLLFLLIKWLVKKCKKKKSSKQEK